MKQSGLQEMLAGIMPQEEEQPEEMMDEFFEVNDEEDFDEQTEEPDFQANLAEDLGDSYLDEIASELLDLKDEDEDSRQKWMESISNLKDAIGIGDEDIYEQPFPGSSTVVYPIITTAQIQFQARALPEIFPDNPAKAVVVGESTQEGEAQAKRVSDVLNYQITYQDKGNKKDFRKMLWWLPLTGSTFRYVYHNPLRNINMVRFVPVEDFIVPYATTSLMDASHFSYRFFDKKNDLLKLINMGFYRSIDIPDDGTDDTEASNPVQKLRDEGDGQTRTTNSTTTLQECYNIYADYDLTGFEDVDEDGVPTGIGLPYVFTIHASTRKVLAIRRNWKQDDEYKLKRIYFAHYQYQEGPGFYGSGLPHLIGSLQTASTGALRAFGDAMAFAMLQAGWKLKDAKFAGSEVFAPGKFQDVDMDIEDINKAIKIANFAPPPQQVLTYIEMLDNKAQALVSTVDVLTGDQSSQNAPVGSTLALIEQAQKVISAQHKGLFESFSEELQILADLNYDFLPDHGEFKVPGKVGIIMREDFDGRVDVLPTADPSVASFQQRQAIDQASMQMFQQFPQFFKDGGFELSRRIMGNLGVPSLDEIMINEEEFAQQQAQAAQNPPPPSPDEVKVQVMQQDAATKAETAKSNATIEQQRLELEEDKMLLDAAIKIEDIEMKAGMSSQQLAQTSDQFAIQQLMQHSQNQMQNSIAKPTAKPLLSQEQEPQPVTEQPIQEEAPQADPEKRNLLLRMIDKIRGR